jgi:hypothetical protein
MEILVIPEVVATRVYNLEEATDLLHTADCAAHSGDYFLGAFRGTRCTVCHDDSALLLRLDLGAWEAYDPDEERSPLILVAQCTRCTKIMGLVISRTGIAYSAFTMELDGTYPDGVNPAQLA